MRVLIHSEAAYMPRGYALQANLFGRALQQRGHEIMLSSFVGHVGVPLQVDGITVFPPGIDAYGNDSLLFYANTFQPDVVLALHDPFVLHADVLEQARVVAWCPVDSMPVAPRVLEPLKHCRGVIVYSRFGQKMLRGVGINAQYVPLAYDPATFYPVNRAEARRHFGLDADTFVVVFVGSNLGQEPRKSPDRLIQAWARFVKQHADAVLLMHTESRGLRGGLDLEALARQLQLSPEHIQFPDQHMLVLGEYGPGFLRDLYNAADVLVLPSRGEGFGLPLVEAQACGCPVITTDFSSMSELCFGGHAIPVDTADDLIWRDGAEQVDVRPSAILSALQQVFEQRGTAVERTLREQALAGAQDYRIEHVTDCYLIPVLEGFCEASDPGVGAGEQRHATHDALADRGGCARQRGTRATV